MAFTSIIAIIAKDSLSQSDGIVFIITLQGMGKGQAKKMEPTNVVSKITIVRKITPFAQSVYELCKRIPSGYCTSIGNINLVVSVS